MKAFPHFFHDGSTIDADEGMDLRDYFAAKAMQAILIGLSSNEPELFLMEAIDNEGGSDRSLVCENAYAIADTMMEMRNE